MENMFLKKRQFASQNYKVYINDGPGLTVTYLRQRQIWSPRVLNRKSLLAHELLEKLKNDTFLLLLDLSPDFKRSRLFSDFGQRSLGVNILRYFRPETDELMTVVFEACVT